MFNKRSPPKYTKCATGGSVSSSNLNNKLTSSTDTLSSATLSTQLCNSSATSRSGSTASLGNLLLNANGNDSCKHHNYNYYHHHHYASHHQHHNQHQQHQQTARDYHHYSQNSSRTSLTPSMKRGKKNWGSRERSGMSFLIVIAFFAVFGLIILTEVFMIDERSHSGMLTMRQGSNLGGNRLGDSMPDYDNVKDDYDLLDGALLSDSKLGFVQFRDNKLKIQEAASDTGRFAGVLLNGGAGGGNGLPLIPWGQILPTKIEETLPHYPFGTQPTDGSWQVVNGTRFKFFVFSAYFDRRDGARLVRIVGATKTRGPERVWCRFWYGQHSNQQQQQPHNASSDGNGQRAKYTSATVMARVKIIRENWNLKYSACFVLCPLHAPLLNVPHYVSVVSRLRAPPGNLLQLRNTDWDIDFAASTVSGGGTLGNVTSATLHAPPTGERIPDKIAVCVKPFHFNYDQALYLMEYLEFYSLLGVSHFSFFNHTMGPHASCVLQHYVDGNVPGNLTAYDLEPLTSAKAAMQSNDSSGTQQILLRSLNYTRPTVTVLPWNLRMRSQKEIRTEGLFAALNDCLYRNMYRYKYLALVDLDEFIVPRYTDTLNELISSLNQRFRNRNTGAYSFQNAFFYLQFADDPLASSLNSEINEELARVRAALVTQRKTRRRFKLHPQKQRSKYICKPEAVIEAGNHFVWEFSPGMGSLNVPPKEAILQHYRVCEFGGNDCIKAPSVVDRTTTKYVNRLVQRIDAVYKHLRKPCNLPPLPVLQKPQMKADAIKTNINNKQTMNMNNNNDEAQIILQAKKAKTMEKAVSAEKLPNSKNKVNEKIKTTKTAQNEVTTTTTNIPKTTTLVTKVLPALKKDIDTVVQHLRKRRKMVIFEQDEYGVPIARVEYQ